MQRLAKRKHITKTFLLGLLSFSLISFSYSQDIGMSDDHYSLDALIEAAQKEGPLTVVDATGKIKDMAKNFEEKYGIKTIGEKLSASEQEEILLREYQADNIKHDVFNMSNLPNVTSQFIPNNIVVSWMPPDLKEETPDIYQNPAITSLNVWVWVYNPDVYGETCPVSNMWELTDEKWNGRISMPDPLTRNETMFWFNQIEDNADDEMRQAYEEYFGEALTEEKATTEWVKRLAANNVRVQRSDTDVGPIVGSSSQENPVIGFVSAAIFSHAEKQNFPLALCESMRPWAGQLTPRVATIATKTKNPNAAKLFVHFMMSNEGMLPQMVDGKLSTNINAEMPESAASHVADVQDLMYKNNSDTTPNDFKNLRYWRDLWIIGNK